jgi:hypothetical protein
MSKLKPADRAIAHSTDWEKLISDNTKVLISVQANGYPRVMLVGVNWQ